MRKTFKITLGLLMFNLGLRSQSLIVEERSKFQTSFSISNIQSINFSGSNIEIFKKQGGKTSFERDKIQLIKFEQIVTSVFETNQSSSFILYPNPATQEIFLLKSKLDFYSKATVEIFNIQGLVMYNTEMDSVTNINISDFPKGVYYARIREYNKTNTINFIKN